MILPNQRFNGAHGLRHTVLRSRRENHGRVEYLSGRIHHGDLAPRSEGRIPAKHRLSRNRCLHEKLPQILAKDLNGTILGTLRELISKLRLDGWTDQTLIGIRTGLPKIRGRRRMPIRPHFLRHKAKDFLFRHLKLHAQYLLLLSAIQRQHTVSRNLSDSFCIVIVVLIYTVFCRLLLRPCGRNQHALLLTLLTNPGTKCGTVRHRFSQNVLGSLNRRLHIRNLAFGIDILRGLRRNRLRSLSRSDVQCKRLQPTLPCNHRPGPSLRLIWAIQILELHHRFCRFNVLSQGIIQLSLLFNRSENRLLPLLQIPKIAKPLIECTQHVIMHPAGGLLPVTRNKGNGVSRVNQSDHSLRLTGFDLKLL